MKKKSKMVSSVHNTRVLRFFLITGIVVLTLFIYATYSPSNDLNPPHMRAATLVSPADVLYELSLPHTQIQTNNSRNENIKEVYGHGKNHKPQIVSSSSLSNKKHVLHHHRPPTIDVDIGVIQNVQTDETAALEQNFISNDLLEEQYIQNVDNSIANLSNTVDVQQITQTQQQLPAIVENNEISVIQIIDNNKILDSDVLIPTSNLQKFIENADKILRNITVSPSAVINSPMTDTKYLKKKLIAAPTIENNDKSLLALPPSSINALKTPQQHINKKTTTTTIKNNNNNKNDKVLSVTTHAIPTIQIYEPGHMNEEINVDKICPHTGKDLKLLILITSAHTHAEARMAIRQTWGHFGMRRDVSMAFILGRTTNQTQSKALTQENYVFGDLIRGHFIDSYNNLTLKTLSALQWVDENCAHTKFILKTDDDMFINVPKLLAFLERNAKDKRVIYGRLAQKWKPIRNKKSKYYVPVEQFSASLYPSFTTGPAYVLSSDIVHDLYTRALQQVYLKLEDVFTTGVVAQQLGIKRKHVNEFLNRRIALNTCNIRKTISVHMIKANEQFDLWKKLLDQTTKCK